MSLDKIFGLYTIGFLGVTIAHRDPARCASAW